jgi:hypothetical protein
MFEYTLTYQGYDIVFADVTNNDLKAIRGISQLCCISIEQDSLDLRWLYPV